MSDHHTAIIHVDNKYECHRTWPRDSVQIIQEQRTPALHWHVQDTPLHLVLATDHAEGSIFEQLLHVVHLRRRQTRRGRQSTPNIATCPENPGRAARRAWVNGAFLKIVFRRVTGRYSLSLFACAYDIPRIII